MVLSDNLTNKDTMPKAPKVSVCVVTYNQEKYIDKCLKSIIEQEANFDFEVIVSDDCSTDETPRIIKDFHKRYPSIIKVVFRDKNIGAYKNFVSTHNLAVGDFVCHCDGDDIFLPLKIQKQYDYFQENPGCTVVWHRMNIFDDDGNFYSGELTDYSMFPNGIVSFSKALSLGSVASHSSIMYKRNARKTYYPDFQTLDLFYSWEYLSSGYGVILNRVLGCYRVSSSGAISKSSIIRIRELNYDHAEYYYKMHPEQKKYIFLFSFTNFLIDVKNKRKTALNFFKLALKTIEFKSLGYIPNHLTDAMKLRVPPLFRVKK